MCDVQTFSMRLDGGIPVFTCGARRVLMDTGSPASFGGGPLDIAGVRHDLAETFGAVAIDAVSPHIPGGIDALVGMDLLVGYDVLLDAPGGKMTFSRRPLQVPGVEIDMPLDVGAPTVRVTVGPHTVTAILDTGAGLSYMDPAAVPGPATDRDTDFHPSVGTFDTDVYSFDVAIAGQAATGRFGVLPPRLRVPLSAFGVSWILGMEVMQRWPLRFDFAHGRLTLGIPDSRSGQRG